MDEKRQPQGVDSDYGRPISDEPDIGAGGGSGVADGMTRPSDEGGPSVTDESGSWRNKGDESEETDPTQ